MLQKKQMNARSRRMKPFKKLFYLDGVGVNYFNLETGQTELIKRLLFIISFSAQCLSTNSSDQNEKKLMISIVKVWHSN
jgi:hypothetical protein